MPKASILELALEEIGQMARKPAAARAENGGSVGLCASFPSLSRKPSPFSLLPCSPGLCKPMNQGPQSMSQHPFLCKSRVSVRSAQMINLTKTTSVSHAHCSRPLSSLSVTGKMQSIIAHHTWGHFFLLLFFPHTGVTDLGCHQQETEPL